MFTAAAADDQDLHDAEGLRLGDLIVKIQLALW